VQLADDPSNTLRVKMWGDDGVNVEFHISEFDLVAEIIRPKGA